MSMFNEGLMIGKFATLTNGHLTAFGMALMKCYKLNVLVCIDHLHDPEDCPMTPEQRVASVKEECARISDRIEVHTIDCTSFPYEKESNEEVSKFWAPILHKMFPNVKTLFGSELYVEMIAKHWPDCMGVNYEILDINRNMTKISATEIRKDPVANWKHIPASVKPFYTKNVLVLGAESCVDADTEFFNGFEWIKISDYKGGEVLQYNEDGTTSLVEPERYIVADCPEFIKFQNSYGNWSQVFSEDHDVAYITSKGNLAKKSALEVEAEFWGNKTGFRGKLIPSATFEYKKEMSELAVTRMKLHIAISADGTLTGNQWRVRLLKERKILRLRELIEASGYEVDERVYEDGYSNFYLPEEVAKREIPIEWLHLVGVDQREELLQEFFLWDGTIGVSSKSYFTTLTHNKDVVSTLFALSNHKVNVYKDEREGKPTTYRVDVPNKNGYRTLDVNQFNGNHKTRMVSRIPSIDGKKYCFTVPSGFLVLRRDDHVFVTGNCGKTTMTRELANIMQAPMVPEMYRSIYNNKGMDFTPADLKDVAEAQWKASKEAARHVFNKGLVLHDTCCEITAMYLTEYFNGHEDYGDAFAKVMSFVADEPKFDAILFCDTNVEWVNDGTRTLGNEDDRKRMRDKAYSLAVQKAKRHGCPLVVMPADYKRLPTALAEVRKVM